MRRAMASFEDPTNACSERIVSRGNCITDLSRMAWWSVTIAITLLAFALSICSLTLRRGINRIETERVAVIRGSGTAERS
jgi:hypothetical protein